MSTAAGRIRKRRNPDWDSELAVWQGRRRAKGLPGTPSEATALAIVAAFGAMHAVGYVATLRLLPKGAVSSGATYGIATNASLWTLSWAAKRYLGETKRPTWMDAFDAGRPATYGGVLGWIVAHA